MSMYINNVRMKVSLHRMSEGIVLVKIGAWHIGRFTHTPQGWKFVRTPHLDRNVFNLDPSSERKIFVDYD